MGNYVCSVDAAILDMYAFLNALSWYVKVQQTWQGIAI